MTSPTSRSDANRLSSRSANTGCRCSSLSMRGGVFLLLSTVSTSNAFQATNRRIHHHPVSSRCRQRTTYMPPIHHPVSSRCRRRTINMPPLYYSDIEAEIEAITVGFNATSSLLSPPPLQSSVEEEEVVLRNDIKEEEAEEGTITKRRRGRPRTKPKKKKKLSLRVKPPHSVIWQSRYNELQQYIQENGHAYVPQKYPVLGLWVMQQRRQYKLLQDGKRSSFTGVDGQKRVQLLEQIGFVWRVERNKPRGVINGGLRKIKHRADMVVKEGVGSESDEILFTCDMGKYMIEKDLRTDEEIIDAWHKRFELFN